MEEIVLMMYLLRGMGDIARIEEWLEHDDGKGHKTELETLINELLNRDFEKLLLLLYKVDVDEHKLKKALADHPSTDAASIIAEMLLRRWKEKKEVKKRFRPGTNLSGEEIW